MKRLFQIACVLLSGLLMFTSCLKSDNDDVTLYDDMAITAFTLGTLNQYLHTTNDAGEDSVYKTTYAGSNYVMSIDQLKHEIYNLDSLPVGTDVGHVLVTISTKNSGVVLLKSPTSDSLAYYSSSDSIDFSTERELQVYATDGSGFRSYKVRLNVSQEEELAGMAWTRVQNEENRQESLEVARAMWLNDQLVLVGERDGLSSLFYTSNDGVNWTSTTPDISNILETHAYCNMAVKDGYLYMLNQHDVLRTADITNWEEVSIAHELSRLLGASTTQLYGYDTDGQLVASSDNGQTWTLENIDEDVTLLPKQQISMVSFPYSTVAETDYVLMVGYDGEEPRIWRKVNEYGAGAAQSRWVYIPQADDNRFQLPVLTGLSLVYYDGSVLAIGREGIYVSRDQGITWKRNSNYPLPDGLEATVQTATADNNGGLWLITGDWQVWHTK